MLENNCSEQASRMSAMESSTKNAKEMLEKLTLSYNRHAPPSYQAPSECCMRIAYCYGCFPVLMCPDHP